MTFSIPKEEVFRYLGVKPPYPEEIDKLVRDGISEAEQRLKPRYLVKKAPILITGEKLTIGGRECGSQEIARLVSGSSECYLLLATLGYGFEEYMQYLSVTDRAKSVVFDAVGTAHIESVCDAVCLALRERLKSDGQFLTRRYSPGYGDFPLEWNRDLIAIGEGRHIGITLLPSLIMLPQKSVTAVMGVTNQSSNTRPPCGNCRDCEFRNRCKFRKEI